MIYIPANENLCSAMIGKPVTYTAGKSFTGAANTLTIAPGAEHIGEVQAWNVDTGARVWTHTFASSTNWGPMLATGGGLVFSGGTSDRMFRAFDAATGKVLWQVPDPVRASSASPRRSWWTGRSTSRCSPAGASMRARCSAALTASGAVNSPTCPKAGRYGCSPSSDGRGLSVARPECSPGAKPVRTGGC